MSIDIQQCLNNSRENIQFITRIRFVLFGFMNKLASHLERSPMFHSFGYESAGDRPACFASLPINSKSCVQYAG
jgi:hypothetical protein